MRRENMKNYFKKTDNVWIWRPIKKKSYKESKWKQERNLKKKKEKRSYIKVIFKILTVFHNVSKNVFASQKTLECFL